MSSAPSEAGKISSAGVTEQTVKELCDIAAHAVELAK